MHKVEALYLQLMLAFLLAAYSSQGSDLIGCKTITLDMTGQWTHGPLSTKPTIGTYLGVPSGQKQRLMNGMMAQLSDGTVLFGITDYVGTNGHRSILATWVKQLTDLNATRSPDQQLRIEGLLWSGEFAIRIEQGEPKIFRVNSTSGKLAEMEKETGIKMNQIENAEHLFRHSFSRYLSPKVSFRTFDKAKILSGEDRLHLDEDINEYIVTQMREKKRLEDSTRLALEAFRQMGYPNDLSAEDVKKALLSLVGKKVFDGKEEIRIYGEHLAKLLPALNLDDPEKAADAKELMKGIRTMDRQVSEREELHALETRRAHLLKAGEDLKEAEKERYMALKREQAEEPNFRHDALGAFSPVRNSLQILELTSGQYPPAYKVLRRQVPMLALFFEKLVATGVEPSVHEQISVFFRGMCRIFNVDAPEGFAPLSVGQMRDLRVLWADKMKSDTQQKPLPIRPLTQLTEKEWAAMLQESASAIDNWAKHIYSHPSPMVETFHLGK